MAANLQSKLKIAEHYLLSAPPAQLDEVQRDVSNLLKPAVFDESGLTAARKAYNVNNNVCIKIADSALPLVLCPEGTLVDGRHVDSFRRLAVAVDHTTVALAAGAGTPADVSSSPLFSPALESLRAAALTALRAYTATHYNPSGVGGQPWARGVEVFAHEGGLLIVTSVTVRNLPNFWSGSWRGRFTVAFPSAAAGGKSQAVVAGSITVRTHYFENGNVQMNDDKTLPPTPLSWPSADPSGLGEGLVGILAAAEGGLVSALDEVYETMSTSVLKEVRRFLPVSGQKMNWHAAEHRMRKTLQTTASGSSSSVGGAGSS